MKHVCLKSSCVEQAELGARMRALSATDQPGVGRPCAKVHEIGELIDPSTGAAGGV
jgi:hypothetical protein